MRNFLVPHRSLFDDFETVFETALLPRIGRGAAPMLPQSFDAQVDIQETKEAYLLQMDLPGLKREDVKVELNGRVLTVSGEKKSLRDFTPGAGDGSTSTFHRPTFHRFERTYGAFERTFTFPDSVDVTKLEAHMADGVLNIAVPKVEVSAAKKIEVQPAQGGLLSRLLSDVKN